MQNERTKKLVVTGLMLAIATVLSLFKIIQFPAGGGITVCSMLPLAILAYRYGVKWGLLSSAIYGYIQILTGATSFSAIFLLGDGSEIWWKAIVISLLDYVIAYMMLGFSGLFRNGTRPALNFAFGTALAVFLRFAVHVVSGAIFYGSYAEWFFIDIVGGDTGAWVMETFHGWTLATIYSASYNGCYMIPELFITAIVAFCVLKIPATAKFIIGKK